MFINSNKLSAKLQICSFKTKHYQPLPKMLIEVEKMVLCLRKMQQLHSDQYNEQLQDICKDQLTLHQFRNIMADNNIQEPTRKMAAVFFKNYLLERYHDFDEVFLIELVISMVLDEKINYKIKILLEELIVSMLEWIEQENIAAIIDCIENVFFTLKRASGNQNFSSEKKSIKKRKDLDPTRLNLNKFLKPNIESQQSFINVSYSTIHLVECFSNSQAIEPQDIHRLVRITLVHSLTIFPIKNNETYLRLQMVILHMWLGYMEKISDLREKIPEYGHIEQEIFEEKCWWTKLLQCYDLDSFNFTGVKGEENLLVCSPQNPQKKLINRIKSYACQIHLKILYYEKQSDLSTYLDNTNSPVVFTQIIKTLSYFSLHKHMMGLCVSEPFINDLLSLFIFVISQRKEIIDNNWTSILHMIAFPLLTIDQKEFKSFEDQPEEFCRLAEDCCDKQRLGEVKTQAARLLEVVSDRNFTYSQYIVQFCCLSIQAALFPEQTKIQNPATFLPLQTAFMAIGVMSYNLNRFPVQVAALKAILLSPQCEKLTQIQISRVFLVLAYNYTEIFQNLMDGKPWINYALNSTLHYTTRIFALDFLINIVDDYFEDEFVVLFSNKISQDNEIKQIWEIVNKLLNHHAQKVSVDTYLILIEKVFQRLQADITRYKQKKIKTTANINSGLELLRKILIITKKLKIGSQQIRNEIVKLVPQYKIFREINLEDVILKILYEFMHFTETISEEFLSTIVQFDLPDEFRRENYRPTPFYWILNQFVFKEQRIDKLRELKNILLDAFKTTYQDYLTDKARVKSNLPLAHSTLILQHLLVLHGQKFSPEQIYEIYDICVATFPEDINEPERLNFAPTIVGRILILIILCYMMTLDRRNIDKERQLTPLKYMLMYHDVEGVFQGQNAYVIVNLLCKGLFKQSDPVTVTEMINMMVRVMRPNKKQDSKDKGKSKSSKNRSMKFKLKSTQNYEAILKKVSTPFDMRITSEQQLKNTLTTMKHNNEPLYKSIINYLPTYIQDKLRDIISTSQMNSMQGSSQKTRRIMRVGGIRTEAGYNAQNNTQDVMNAGKRNKNFDSESDDENELEIDENEHNGDSSNGRDNDEGEEDKQDRKGKMKNRKKIKKLQENESTSNHKNFK